MHFLGTSVFALASLSLVACGARPDTSSESQSALLSDASSMNARGDGTFDVVCKDGRHEVDTADQIRNDQTCISQTATPSPFGENACSGAPLTEGDVNGWLGDSNTSRQVGTFALAFRARSFSSGTPRQDSVRWDDDPNQTLIAYYDSESPTIRGRKAMFTNRGTVEALRDASGSPYLRLVGEPTQFFGPDTTHRARFVSEPIRPWGGGRYESGVIALTLQESYGDGDWHDVTEYGYSIEVASMDVANHFRSWAFGVLGSVAFATRSCAQYVSAMSDSDMSPADEALAFYVSFK